MAGPLTGLRVLDLSRVMAGPWCTQIFADLGAEVIKIERPEIGDDTRHWGPPWRKSQDNEDVRQSSYFLSANRGKYSVTIDLGTQKGRDLAKTLSAKCDILVENFKNGDLEKKGLGYNALSEANPGLIYCSITGFGQTGPMKDLPGYDYLIQAQGGLMSVTGVPDGQPGAGPQRSGIAVSDLTAGMNAAIAVLAALHHRNNTGRGQHIDLALLDVQVSWLANQAQNYFCSGKAPVRTGEYHPNLAPYQPFPASDGKLIIAVGNDMQFQRLCEVLDLAELSADPRFETNPDRVVNRAALVTLLEEKTKQKTCESLADTFRGAAIPCGPIQSIEDVFSDPQIAARKMKTTLDHPVLGAIPTVANPIKYSDSQVEYSKAPPLLGEDTQSVLGRILKLSAAEIAQLHDDQVI